MLMRRFLLIILLFLYYCSSFAQYNANVPFILNFTKSEYQGGNQNWSIATTDEGIVYIGNNQGLMEFDGSNWNLIKMPGELTIRSVAVNNTDKIYVGAYEEFGYWKVDKSNRKKYVSLSDSISVEYFHNDEIWRIIPVNDTIYFQSFNSIYIYNGRSIETFPLQSTVVFLSKARNRLFIQKINDGIYELKDKKLNYISGSRIFSDDEVKFVIPFQQNKFLVGASEKGLYVYDGKSFYPWEHENRELLESTELNNGVLLDSLIVTGTIVDGIFIFDHQGRLIHHLNSADYLQNNTVLSLEADKSGNIWAGLDQGVDYINMHSPLDFFVDFRKEIGSVYNAELFNDKLWVGTNQGLYAFDFFSDGELSKPQLIQGSQGQVWDVFKLNQQLYVGHNNGTYCLSDQEDLTKISDISGGYDFESFIHKDKKYGIQSTYSNLVMYEIIDGKWRFSHIIQGFVEPVVNIEWDQLGNLWGKHTYKGIFKFTLNPMMDSVLNVNFFGKEEGLPQSNDVNLAYINHRLVFTTGNGLYVYDDLNDSIIPYSALNEQLGMFKKARRVIKTNDSNYWFILNNTISLIEIKGYQVKELFSYDLSRQNFNLLFRHPNVVALEENFHLICLDNGFALFDQKLMPEKLTHPEVKLRKVITRNNKDENKFLSLENPSILQQVPYSYRNIEFVFSSTDVYDRSLYRYKLKGLNQQFTGWRNKSTVDYIRLPYGNYQFIVQTKNIQGKLSPEFSYDFEVLPPWYLSKMVVVIYFILLVVGLYFLRMIFLKRVKKHAIEVEQREKEKRRREQMLVEQQYMQIKNRDLQSEIASKSIELANYTMTIIHKNEVLLRIKQELQDLKKELGTRFPNYQYKKLVKILDRNLSPEDEWKTFQSHFDKAYENFFKRLKAEYPELTPNDLKLCAYLRLNLSTKEIAPLLNISIRGVEVRRYRLRKRLKLSREENLVEFLMSF